jgi:predicted component of type VI protein secretion system
MPKAHLEPRQAQHQSKQELRTMVRRLLSSGMNSEEVKEWFVAELPQAMTYASKLGLRSK